jgi:hypothetical protein
MRIDVSVLTETRLPTDRYTRSAYGYTVFATQTTHTNQGGIALIFTNSLYLQIESQQKHGPNVIRLESGTREPAKSPMTMDINRTGFDKRFSISANISIVLQSDYPNTTLIWL